MKRIHVLIILGLVLALSGCSLFSANSSDSKLTASGIIAGTDVKISSELSGKVAEINVAEGDAVKAGDVLFKLDTSLLGAQRNQAAAALEEARQAQATADAAQAVAQAQYDQVLSQIHSAQPQQLQSNWQATQPSEIDQPNWYFTQDESIQAADAEVTAAQDALNQAQDQLNAMLAESTYKDVVAAENRLAQAQVAFQNASQVHDQTDQVTGSSQTLRDRAQDIYDSAQSELNAAQSAYTKLLSNSAVQDFNDARARVAIAQARLDDANARRDTLNTGDQDPRLKAASAGLEQAKAADKQAAAGVNQAQAALDLIDMQISKATIQAPSAGVISARNLEVGELVAAGGTVMTISQLEEVSLTVYIPEDRYGQVQLGQEVSITVDSFPGQKFGGTVQYISSEAEFTPSNVQTVEGRKATVYAVKIRVPNKDLLLKSGMPADVSF